MSQLDLRIIPVTPFAQNCSLLFDSATKEAVLVDPGGEADKILADLDHAGGADEIREKTGVPVIGPHKDDQFWMDDIAEHWANYGHPGMGRNVVPDRYLEDGEQLSLSGASFDVVHTPGHTPGHVVIYNSDMKIAFVGDVLFRGSVGRTDFPKSNTQDLIDSIRTKLWPLGNDMRFIPGHGPMSTFGAERADNPFVGDRVIGNNTPNNSGVM